MTNEANEIDYRALLVKYMRNVIDCEGVSFTDNGMFTGWKDHYYTPAERAELDKIEQEAREDL